MSSESPPRRVSITRRIVLAVVAMLGVCLAVAVIQYLRSDTGELDRLIAELDTSEPNWRLGDLDRERATIPDAENSASLVLPLMKRVPSYWPVWDSATVASPANERLAESQLASIRAELARVESLRVEARKLIDWPRGRLPVTWDPVNPYVVLPNELKATQQLAGLLECDSLELAHAGQVTQAVRSAHAAVNLSRSLGDESMMLSQFTRAQGFLLAASAVERALALGESDEKTLAALQALLLDDEKHDGLTLAWRGERAGKHALLDRFADRTLTYRDLGVLQVPAGTLWRGKLWPQSLRGLAQEEQLAALKATNRGLAIARLPSHERLAASRTLDSDVSKSNTLLLKAIFPPHQNLAGIHIRKLALNRCLIVLVAAERFRLKTKRWPKDLDELKPGYLTEVPLDACAGKALRYRVLPDGIVIYSVGLDGTDDGGNIDCVRMPPGTDLGYRAWNVGERNRDAKGAKE